MTACQVFGSVEGPGAPVCADQDADVTWTDRVLSGRPELERLAATWIGRAQGEPMFRPARSASSMV